MQKMHNFQNHSQFLLPAKAASHDTRQPEIVKACLRMQTDFLTNYTQKKKIVNDRQCRSL